MKPAAIPGLDALAVNPTLAEGLSAAVRHALTLRALLVLAALAVPPSANGDDGHEPGVRAGDQLLTAVEAARRLAVSTDWLWRNSSKLPFTVRPTGGRAVRFSEVGLARYLQQRQGRP